MQTLNNTHMKMIKTSLTCKELEFSDLIAWNQSR